MNLRQRSSRYGATVLFMAGIAGALLLVAIINSGLKPDFEIWLASALVVSLILHARAGFALSRAQQEIELLRGLVVKFRPEATKLKSFPQLKFGTVESGESNDDGALKRVKAAIENDRVDLYLQPVVSLPQRKLRYFEAFSRLRNEDDSILRPCDYLDAAERANRIGVIDNMILLRAVQALRQLGKRKQDCKIFCNISPATIFDTDFFVRFTDYLDANDDIAQQLVFEFTYPATEIMHERVEKNLNLIAKRGYAFSVDHVRRFDLNWAALRRKNFQFVKMASAMLVNESKKGEAGVARVKEFIDQLRDNDFDLIIEKIEDEASLSTLIDMGVDFGQGNLFGAPQHVNCFVEEPQELAKAS